MIDVAVGQLTMSAHDNVEIFDVYKALKMPTAYKEFSAITIIYLYVEAKYIVVNNTLERVLVGDDLYSDVEAQEVVQFFDVSLILTIKNRWEPLNRILGPPPKMSIEEAPKLELKTLTTHLRYAFSG